MMIKTIIKKSTYSLLGLLITSHTFADDGDLTLQQTKTLKPNMKEMRETYNKFLKTPNQTEKESLQNLNKKKFDKRFNEFEEKLDKIKTHKGSSATKKSAFPKKTMDKQTPGKDESIEEFRKQPVIMDKQDFNAKDEKLDKELNKFEESSATKENAFPKKTTEQQTPRRGKNRNKDLEEFIKEINGMDKQTPRKDESIEGFEKQPAEIDKQDFNTKDENLDKLISEFEEKLAKTKTQKKKRTKALNKFEENSITKKSEFPKKTMEQPTPRRKKNRNKDLEEFIKEINGMDKQTPRKDEGIEGFEKQPAEIDKQDFNTKDENLDKLISEFEEKLAKTKTQKKKRTSHNSFESKLNPQDWETIKSDFFSNDTYIGYQVVDSYNNLAPLIITNVEQQDTNEPISVDVNVYVKDTKVDNHLIIGRTYAWENDSQSISYTSNGNKYKINFKLKPLRHYPKTDTIGILIPEKSSQKTKDIQHKRLPLDKEIQRRPSVKKTERQQALETQLL